MQQARVLLVRVFLFLTLASLNNFLINPALSRAAPLYQPVIKGSDTGFVTQTQTYTVETAAPYTKTVTWFVNGEKQMATGAAFMPTFTLPGVKTIVARIDVTREQATFITHIHSYSGISLESLLPNPFEPDAEEVVVRNQNSFPVSLQNWRLQSQASRALVPIDVIVPGNATATIKAHQRLVNNGGAYGLYNEAQQLVDSVVYGHAQPGDRLYREQTLWRFASFDVEESEPRPTELMPLPTETILAADSSRGPRQDLFLPPVTLTYSAWLRVWINILIAGGYILLSSSGKKPV